MFWCFAIVNNKLAEIFFDKDSNEESLITGHCYVKRQDYRTKQEQHWIDQDTKKARFFFKKGEYKPIKKQR
ncbi:hypothetical protein FJ208_01940 [Candidatus Gribaldobacteria bacterium]|nr:hypothetical protein [Candidatus Gribaldobacteria bacterium]